MTCMGTSLHYNFVNWWYTWWLAAINLYIETGVTSIVFESYDHRTTGKKLKFCDTIVFYKS